jgi:hypothetical protein
VGKSEGRRPLGKPRRRWVNSIKMDVGEIGLDVRDWIELSQDRDQWRALVNTVMNLRVLSKCWQLSTRLYAVTYQKTVILIRLYLFIDN